MDITVSEIMSLLYSWKMDSDNNLAVLERRYRNSEGYARRKAKAEHDYMSAQAQTVEFIIGEIYDLQSRKNRSEVK